MKKARKVFSFVLALTLISSMIIAPHAETSMLLGDADGDGEICITDATMIQRDVAKITEIDDNSRRSADIDSDGIISIMDATIIQRWLVHFSVKYPIGKPMYDSSLSTEESIPVPTEALSQQPSVIRNSKTVTVDGIAFNISKIPDVITLNNSTGNTAKLILQNKILPAPDDIHIVISGCDNFRRFTYNDARFREYYLASDDRKGIGSDYLISDNNGNDIAWVDAHLTNTAYPYQVFICGFSGTSCSFSVDFYYRNVLLKQCKVTVDLSVGSGNSDETKALVREIENACWEPDMSDKEKMKAFAEHIKSHYTLRQLKCVDGAIYTAFAARYLGLDAMLFYPEENGHPDLMTYNLYFDTTIPGGHCACLVEYEDGILRYDVQGGACVISSYNG
nr:dockerin type I repeat-containing protein [uncultured Ruminococcus sp.]